MEIVNITQKSYLLPLLAHIFVTLAAISACRSNADSLPPSPPVTVASATIAVATSVPSPPPTAKPESTPSPANADVPRGFPLPPDLPADLVRGDTGARVIAPRAGATVREVAERVQHLSDPVAANASGWNCAVHAEYEGTPAIDWYVQPGTPVYATMDGTATLFVNTLANAFDYYAADREPYIGNPDRTRAPRSPFPGPGGGMGVYVSVTSAAYRTDYGHLLVAPTLGVVPSGAFANGFSAQYGYSSAYTVPRDFRVADVVAAWDVRRGDVVGYTGDSGYSEAPHLHYQITRRSDGARLCPGDGGW